jgi:hypothetical protein
MESPAPGSYSVVLLRRVVAGKVQTQLVAGEIYPRGGTANAPNLYDIAAVLDLNGDGRLEVVMHPLYYEGGATIIYQCDPKKIEPFVFRLMRRLIASERIGYLYNHHCAERASRERENSNNQELNEDLFSYAQYFDSYFFFSSRNASFASCAYAPLD